MAAINFPNSPANNDTHVVNGTTYTWDATKGVWNITEAAVGGGASVSVAQTAPISPSPENGDLWWDSEEGRLYVYYIDANTSQWVEAAPDALGYTGSQGYTGSSGYTGSLGYTGSAVNFANSVEIDTGTLTGEAIDPDTLAGSYAGTKSIVIIIADADTAVTAGDDQASFIIPSSMNGMNLVRANAVTRDAGNTGSTTVDVFNVTDNTDMLSAAISIGDDVKVGTPGTIDTAADDVATDDEIRIDVTTVHSGTAPNGLKVSLDFRLP